MSFLPTTSLKLLLGQTGEGSEILPYLQASKTARHSFMASDRGHETPGSQMKGLITHGEVVARVPLHLRYFSDL